MTYLRSIIFIDNMENNKNKKIVLFGKYVWMVVVVFVIVTIILIIIDFVDSSFSKGTCINSFKLINADVVCGKPAVIKKAGYIVTENKINAFIQDEKDAGRLTEAAVYFRDLKNGPVFGINETVDFAPASLLKLPLALAYLTSAERDPRILKKQLSVAKPQWNFSEYYPPTETIDPTQPHTIEELIERMLRYSDNNSYGVIQAHIYETGQKGIVTQTFLELGFLDPANIDDEVINVRQYASIFRVLYNVSFLDDDFSEKVLEWLMQSDFTRGLKNGVPRDIKIAHKFGERTSLDGARQLHDCGIVYYPQNPYLLCVMTRGRDFNDLEAVISHISKEVYQEVDSRRLQNLFQ